MNMHCKRITSCEPPIYFYQSVEKIESMRDRNTQQHVDEAKRHDSEALGDLLV